MKARCQMEEILIPRPDLYLERDVIVLGVDLMFLGQILRVFRLQQMDSHPVPEQPTVVRK